MWSALGYRTEIRNAMPHVVAALLAYLQAAMHPCVPLVVTICTEVVDQRNDVLLFVRMSQWTGGCHAGESGSAKAKLALRRLYAVSGHRRVLCGYMKRCYRCRS